MSISCPSLLPRPARTRGGPCGPLRALRRVLARGFWGGLLCGVALLAACGEAPLPRGVVALVDGHPIHLRTLQTLQDTRTAGLGAFEKPSLSTLRQQYGSALATLIAQALVLQEMDRLGMPVGEAAVSEAEMRIRQDYPDDEFEKHLRESSIDLDAWRELMRHRIGMVLFAAQVLEPRISIPLEEVEAYYTRRKDDFVVPRLLTVYQVAGEDREKLEKARGAGIPDDSPEMRVFRLSLRREQLPDAWKKAVLALKEGEATPVVKAAAGGFEYVVLTEDMPERHLSVVEAYPYIEQLLMQEKLEEAFDVWLEERLKSARVLVSTHLAEELREKG